MKVRFTSRARGHLRAIFLHVRASNPAAAEKLVETIEDLATQLAGFPDLGRAFDGQGRRILTVPGLPYRIVYRVAAEEIRILMVRHTSRRPLSTS
jgi:toxin ParE1/3/4